MTLRFLRNVFGFAARTQPAIRPCAAALVVMACLVGCSAQPRILEIVRQGETSPLAHSPRHDEGIVVNGNETILVNLRKKPALAVLDELAYKKRFSYTVFTDLSGFKLDIGQTTENGVVPKLFADENELLEEITQRINVYLKDGSRIEYRWEGDGPVFYRTDARQQGKAARVCPGTLEKPRLTEPPETHDVACIGFKKIFLNNVTVEDAANYIEELFLNKDLTYINHGNKENTSYIAYKYQNALIIRSADYGLLKAIGEMLYSFDADFPQVLVETQVYQYNEHIGRRIGTALEIARSSQHDDQAKKLALNTQFGEGITNALPTFFFSLTDADQRRTLLATIAAFDQEGRVRVIAEPKLMLKSGEQASVKLNTVKYIAISGVNTSDLRDLSAGVEFQITPTLLGGEKILLKIELTQSEFIPTNEEKVVQSINQNFITSSIVARDGETVSIGGISTRRESLLQSGIPTAKDIPILGNLFGSKARDSDFVRVEFMITPTISGIQRKQERTAGEMSELNRRMDLYLEKESSGKLGPAK